MCYLTMYKQNKINAILFPSPSSSLMVAFCTKQQHHRIIIHGQVNKHSSHFHTHYTHVSPRPAAAAAARGAPVQTKSSNHKKDHDVGLVVVVW